MTIQTKHSQPTPLTAITHKSKSSAYWVSQICNPPLMAMTGVLIVGAYLNTAVSWLNVLAYVTFTILMPTAYVFLLLKQGKISDIHLPLREERIRPSLMMVAGTIISWFIINGSNADLFLQAMTSMQVLQSFILLVITFRWKISAHATGAATTAVLTLWLFGAAALPFVALAAAICWSRITLKRHTPAQVVGGLLLGATTMSAALIVYTA